MCTYNISMCALHNGLCVYKRAEGNYYYYPLYYFYILSLLHDGGTMTGNNCYYRACQSATRTRGYFVLRACGQYPHIGVYIGYYGKKIQGR